MVASDADSTLPLISRGGQPCATSAPAVLLSLAADAATTPVVHKVHANLHTNAKPRPGQSGAPQQPLTPISKPSTSFSSEVLACAAAKTQCMGRVEGFLAALALGLSSHTTTTEQQQNGQQRGQGAQQNGQQSRETVSEEAEVRLLRWAAGLLEGTGAQWASAGEAHSHTSSREEPREEPQAMAGKEARAASVGFEGVGPRSSSSSSMGRTRSGKRPAAPGAGAGPSPGAGGKRVPTRAQLEEACLTAAAALLRSHGPEVQGIAGRAGAAAAEPGEPAPGSGSAGMEGPAGVACAGVALAQQQQRVLGLLSSVPFAVATPCAAQAATQAWSWLLARRQHMAPALVGCVLLCWERAQRQGRGLFRCRERRSQRGPREALQPKLVAPFSPGADLDPDSEEGSAGQGVESPQAQVEALVGAGIVVSWLMDRLEVVQQNSINAEDSMPRIRDLVAHYAHHGVEELTPTSAAAFVQLRLLVRLLQRSFSAPLTQHPAARTPVFSLLTLGLTLCQSQLKAEVQAKGRVGPTSSGGPDAAERLYDATEGANAAVMLRLRRDILSACLAWFSVPPEWFEHQRRGCVCCASTPALGSGVRQCVGMEGGTLSSDKDVSTCKRLFMLIERHLSTRIVIAAEKEALGPQAAVEPDVLQLVRTLLQHELQRCIAWAYPTQFPMKLDQAAVWNPSMVPTVHWKSLVHAAWEFSPSLALALTARFPTMERLGHLVTQKLGERPLEARHCPEALPLLLAAKGGPALAAVQQLLPYWDHCSIIMALSYLRPPYCNQLALMAYFQASLSAADPLDVLFFMPQLVQALRHDKPLAGGAVECGPVEQFLLTAAKRDSVFAHVLIWQLQGEEEDPEGGAQESEKKHKKEKKPVERNVLWDIVPRVRSHIIASFNAEERATFEAEFQFFDAVTSISGTLKPVPKEKRRAAIRPELEKIAVPPPSAGVYLPVDPHKKVRGVRLDSGIPLQSAAKVPIMITFIVVDESQPHEAGQEEAAPFPQACIFKVGDDCRQDVLALQVISLMRDVNRAVGLDLYLAPYGVLPTGYERGIIEVVPNTRSRNQMGDIADGGLYDIFQNEFGPEGSPALEAARLCFIRSSAAYAVASLILQPKDRHNGNLLIDKFGHLVHIDFGFILETSPGGNMRFEGADFKLSHEMSQILDPSGAMKSEHWNLFVNLCIKGYLAARGHADAMCDTVMLMLESGLPCFSIGDPMGNLRRRFHQEMSEREAATFMLSRCAHAYNNWRTAGYDLVQYLQQGILR